MMDFTHGDRFYFNQDLTYRGYTEYTAQSKEKSAAIYNKPCIWLSLGYPPIFKKKQN